MQSIGLNFLIGFLRKLHTPTTEYKTLKPAFQFCEKKYGQT